MATLADQKLIANRHGCSAKIEGYILADEGYLIISLLNASLHEKKLMEYDYKDPLYVALQEAQNILKERQSERASSN